MPKKSPAFYFSRLLKIATLLRSARGCPWDRQQTIQTLLPKVLEEAHEVRTAVRKKDWDNLGEEIGDVILTLILLAQIAKEEKLFDMGKILQATEKKVRRRHSWVFGKDQVRTAAEALKKWKENKKKERIKKTAE
jgi:uncharacterized protein YabN with tetrapyrrole methylase and pyrophosphatase domain